MEYQYVVKLCRSTEIREYPTRPYPVKTNNNSTRGEAGFVQGECSSRAERVGFKVYLPQITPERLSHPHSEFSSYWLLYRKPHSSHCRHSFRRLATDPSLPTFTVLVVAATDLITVVVEPIATFMLSPFFSRLITWSSLQLCVSVLPEPLSPERVAVFLIYLSVRR
ncbi:uncharacterized protein DS421_17g584570 [Arachis hypogaea]|nr:uncharacterized protein DS421_17g584570 [Arachis hypogaea]